MAAAIIFFIGDSNCDIPLDLSIDKSNIKEQLINTTLFEDKLPLITLSRDPVMRYMMDALAADELQGETKPEAYAFASYSDGETEQVRIEWKAKGVTPLLYEVPAGKQDHSLLHLTLKEWASTYRDGVQGKEMIIAQHASTPPLASSRSDFAVGRVLWALTDRQAAKHFADLSPVPPLEWLEPLSANLFGHQDLSQFGITANSKHDAELSFSLLQRPMAYTHSPRMCVLNMGGEAVGIG